MFLYLLNSPVLTGYGQWQFTGPLPLAQARDLVADGQAVSAIGHAATAQHLARLLGCAVPSRRQRAELQPGDRALVYRLLQRLPEGQVLDAAALADLLAEFGLLVRLA